MKMRGYIVFHPDKKEIKAILTLSLPLIPHVLGSIIIAISDRLFIEKMVSLEMVGIYSVGYMFGMVVMLFTDAFIKAWNPWFFKNMTDPTPEQKRTIVKYSYLYIATIFVLAILISFVAGILLPYVVDEKYQSAKQFILWIAIGYAFQGIYKIFFPYLVHLNRTSFLAFSTVTAAIINLILNYVLIEKYGAIGAAYATIIAFCVSGFLVFWYQKRMIEMPWTKVYKP
jgi:O-antigen/teichoic acid export membrane protein